MSVNIVDVVRTEVARALAALGVAAGDRVACACSGGPDSLVLADALIALRPGGVALVTVDHGLRASSSVDAAAVLAFGRAQGVPAEAVCVQVVRAGRGLEDAARQARYAALDAAADRLGAPWIALGHTASDQAETVLGRMLRGAGVAGLAGIPPRRGRYIRPLLGIQRQVVTAYVAARALVPVHDAMNDDPGLLRTRLRHTHLPALRVENPALDAALGRTAAALREASEAIDWMARNVPVVRDARGVRLPVAALRAVPPAVAKRAIALHAEAIGTPLEGKHLDAVLALVQPPAAGTRGLDLPRLRASRVYDDLELSIPGDDARAAAVTLPGHTVRTWRPGDRMRPARLRGRSRKLQDLFTDHKVPRALRRSARVVVRERDGAIVYTEHIGASFDAEAEFGLTIADSPVIYD